MFNVANFKVPIDQLLPARDRSLALSKFAQDTTLELIASGRAPLRFRRYVDGVANGDPDNVRPDGEIRDAFQPVVDIVPDALDFLVRGSPIGASSRSKEYNRPYRDSFFVAVNGSVFMMDEFDPKKVPDDAQIVIGNMQPYQRKVDVQFIGTKKLNYDVAPNLFARCVAMLQGRYGNTLSIRRVYTWQFPGQYTLRQRQMRRGLAKHLVKRSVGDRVESPVIVITSLRA